MGHDAREPGVDFEAEHAPETPPEPIESTTAPPEPIERASAPPEPIEWTAAPADEPEAPPEPGESTAAADSGPATEWTSAGRKVIRIKYHPPYDALGWTLDNTPKRHSVRDYARPERPALVSKWTRAAMLFVLWMVVLGTSLSVSGDDPSADVVLPAELLGLWQTEAPKYADRFFDLSRQQLVFATGGSDRAVNYVTRVTRITEPRGLLYTVWYSDAVDARAEPQPLRFYYDSSAQVIRFKTQWDIPWERVGPPGELRRLMLRIEDSSRRYEEQWGHIRQRPNRSPEEAAP